MLTIPSPYEKDYQRSGAMNITLVRIEYDAGTGLDAYWFSNHEIGYIDEASDPVAHVYPLLISHTGIKEKIDYFRKSWQVANITLKFSNAPYLNNTTASSQRLSDLFDNLVGASIQIWLLAGSDVPFSSVTLSSYGIKRFDGITSNVLTYDDDVLMIKAYDLSYKLNKLLPEEYIGDVYSAEEWLINETRKLPIVYGIYSGIQDDAAYAIPSGTGLAIAEKISGFAEERYVVSDKAIEAIDDIYIKLPGLSIPALYLSADYTVTLDDSDRTTFVIDNDAEAYAYILMEDASSRGAIVNDTNYHADMVDYENAVDGDDATFAVIEDDIDNGVGNLIAGGGVFMFGDMNFLRSTLPDSGSNIQPDEYITDFKVQYKIDEDILSLSYTGFELLLDHNDLGTPVTFLFTPSSSRQTSADQIANLYGVNFDSIAIKSTHLTAGDGTANNATMLEVYDVRLRCLMSRKALWHRGESHRIRSRWRDITRGAPDPTPFTITDFGIEGQTYFAGEGMVYGAWLDANHSGSDYSSGDTIQNPIGIIESLLRDYLGITDIDVDSFDAEESIAANSARLNITADNEAMGFDIIRQLAEQSTFAFYLGATGQAKAIKMNSNSPTTSVIIPYSNIVNGHIKVSKTDWIINNIHAESNYFQEYGKYIDVDIIDNTTSQAQPWGTRSYTAKWPNINGLAVEHLLDHYITNRNESGTGNDPVWGYPRPVIEFSTPGFMYQHLEIGDWIELDDTTVDPHIKLFGASWSGVQFIISELQNMMYGTRIKAIGLLDT